MFERRRLPVLMFAASLCAWSSSAEAGDPCPISFNLINLGPMGGSSPSVPVEKDEIFAALKAYVAAQECAEVNMMIAHDGEISLGKTNLHAWVLQELLVGKKRAFRCKDAHDRLAALSAFPQNATVVYQRGRRRVLLTTARWQTICVPISDLTGKNSKAALTRLWSGATAKVVKDRYDNP